MYLKQKNNEQRQRTQHFSMRGEKPSPRDYETRRPKEKEMIFGIRAVIEALDAGKTLDKIMLRRDMSSALARE